MYPTDSPAVSSSGALFGSWKPSHYTVRSCDADGNLILYNSLSSSVARIPSDEAPRVESALREGFVGFPRGVFAELVLNGFFVQSLLDEIKLVDQIDASQLTASDMMQLILLPNENCNFRCKYCSQSFARNRMERRVIEAIVRLITRRAPDLKVLAIGWFGGEPLTAPDVIEEVSRRLQEVCRIHAVDYSASITTNGYLLTPSISEMLFRAEVRRFQITLDGLREDHDRLRVLADGRRGTFDRILENLRRLRESAHQFRIVIRTNFDPNSLGKMDSFLNDLETDFRSDERFILDFHPVGRWGGPHDRELAVCGIEDGRLFSLDLADRAAKRGFALEYLKAQLSLFGSRCYAANPHTFVIGSDGTIYKCTVAFDDERNKVGQITDDGRLLIDAAKHALWISSGATVDATCKSCSFRPSCHGNACPLHRMNTGDQPCPSVKRNIHQALRVLTSDLVRRIEGAPLAPEHVGQPPTPRRT